DRARYRAGTRPGLAIRHVPHHCDSCRVTCPYGRTEGCRRVRRSEGAFFIVPYEVSTPVFEGPFDLLLHLILKEEVDLWEISLVPIVDAFCAQVARMDHVDLEVTTEFLLIAATLVDLKARRLLPGRDDIDLDEELMRFEERDFLLARLLECKTFQDAAKVLHERLVEARRS